MRCLLSKNNKFKKWWDYAIIVAAIFSVVTIPIKFAIHPMMGETDFTGTIYFVADITTYIMYWLDIFINLRTTYIDSYGEEIKSEKMICMRYFRSFNFYIDVLSLLNWPTRGFGNNKVLSFFGILKAVRITKMQSLITESHFQKSTKVILKITYYFVFFMFYLHIMGCFWFFVIEYYYKQTQVHASWCHGHLQNFLAYAYPDTFAREF